MTGKPTAMEVQTIREDVSVLIGIVDDLIIALAKDTKAVHQPLYRDLNYVRERSAALCKKIDGV